jgi:hypothetical protein
MNTNYLPGLIAALRELNPEEPIHFAITLDKTPMLFVLAIRKLIRESGVDIRMYHRDNSEPLRLALQSYGMDYFPLEKFPDYEEALDLEGTSVVS